MIQKTFELESLIAKVLRAGVLLAGLLMGIGWLIDIQFSENPFLKFQKYETMSMSLQLLKSWQSQSIGVLISYLGLFTLISLPLFRVILTAVLFLKQKEYILAGISFLVFSGLILSFVLGVNS